MSLGNWSVEVERILEDGEDKFPWVWACLPPRLWGRPPHLG